MKAGGLEPPARGFGLGEGAAGAVEGSGAAV
jgi:hypothetical protein